MFKSVDGRALTILGLMILAFLVNFLWPITWRYTEVTETIMLFTWSVCASLLAYLTVREGFCLLRTHITREEHPFLFWAEVLFSLMFAGVVFVKLAKHLSD